MVHEFKNLMSTHLSEQTSMYVLKAFRNQYFTIFTINKEQPKNSIYNVL
jgi:hypothetical protein